MNKYIKKRGRKRKTISFLDFSFKGHSLEVKAPVQPPAPPLNQTSVTVSKRRTHSPRKRIIYRNTVRYRRSFCFRISCRTTSRWTCNACIITRALTLGKRWIITVAVGTTTRTLVMCTFYRVLYVLYVLLYVRVANSPRAHAQIKRTVNTGASARAFVSYTSS